MNTRAASLLRRSALFLAMMMGTLTFLFILTPTARADSPIFVRPGGDDFHCNGSANQDYTPAVAPTCAVKTMQKGFALAQPGDTVTFTAGTFTTTVPVADEVSMAAGELSVQKQASSNPVTVGTPLTYTIVVTNNQLTALNNVIVQDFLPPTNIVDYASGTATVNPSGSCTLSTPDPPVISCTIGTLSGEAVTTVTIPVTPTAADVSRRNLAVAVASGVDSVSADTFTTFAGDTNLTVSKSDSPDPVPAGQPLTYTLTITNHGPVAAGVVTVTDQLPGSVSFNSIDVTQGTCSLSGSDINCNLGFMAISATARITIGVTPNADGVITNTAIVTPSGTDNVPAGNVSTQTTTVTPAANLSISKSDGPDPVSAGGTLTYTLTALNNGPSTAQGVVVTDTLPASVTISSVDPPTTTQNGRNVSWNLGNLASGASAKITVVVTVNSAATGSLTNTATITSNTADLDTGNNQITTTTTIDSDGVPDIYLPIILKAFSSASPSLSMQWDGLEPVRDRVKDLDGGGGLATDGKNDGVFKIFLNVGSSGAKTLADARLTSTQSFEWDTITGNSHPILGVFDGSTAKNNTDGTLSRVSIDPGLVTLHLYVSDDTGGSPTPRFPPDTYTYTLTINFTDGTSLVASATIPPESSTLPPTSLAYVTDVAAHPGTNQIFVASPRHSKLYVIDGASDTVSRTVTVGNGPTGLAVFTDTTPANSKVFVAHQYGANNWRPGFKALGVNDTTSHNTEETGYVGVAPIKTAANATNNRVYVSNYIDRLAVLDGSSAAPEDRLGWVVQRGFQGAYGIDTSTATNRVYLATRDTGELVVFDGSGDRLLNSGYIPTHVKPPQACSLWSVAVNEATGHVFVPCPQLGKLFVLQENQVSLLDLETLGVLEEREGHFALVVSPAAAPWIAEVNIPTGTGEEGIAVDTNTGLVFMTNAGSNKVVVVQDGSSPAYVTDVPVGVQPQGVDVNPDTQKLYVGNTGDNTVTVLAATTPFTQVKSISLDP